MSDTGTASARVMIIGCGDSLRGDDAAGPIAARKLGDRLRADTRVKSLAVNRLTPELALPVSNAELVVFIDSAPGQRAGHLSCTFITPTTQSAADQLDPPSLVAMAHSRHGRTAQAIWFTVAGEDFSQRQRLSRNVERACERLTDQVYRIVIDELAQPSAEPQSPG